MHREATIVAGSSLDLDPEPPVRGQGLSRPRGGYGWGGYRWSPCWFWPWQLYWGKPRGAGAGRRGRNKEGKSEGRRTTEEEEEEEALWNVEGPRE